MNAWVVVAQGLVTGLVFGILMQRGRLSRLNVVIGQFLLRDFTVAKVMLSAIFVGGIFMHVLLAFGVIKALPLEPSNLTGSALGGLIFGAGISLLGYCPGGALAAVGDGARDAIWGVLGLFTGSLIFIRHAAWFDVFLKPDALSATTLAIFSGLSPWLFFAAMWCVLLGLHLIPRRQLR